MYLIQLLILIIFLAGLYFYTKYDENKIVEEAMTNNITTNKRCPNILLQKGSRFYLYNSKLAIIPGVNPISFDNLEDYTEFLDWQHSQGIRCPVLYLQQSYDTQGSEVYKVRPDIIEPEGGMSPVAPSYISNRLSQPTYKSRSNIDEKAFNANKFNTYESTPYTLSKMTEQEEIDYEHKRKGKSPNPMDPNWGGAEYTQSLVDKGYYKDNEVSIAVA